MHLPPDPEALSNLFSISVIGLPVSYRVQNHRRRQSYSLFCFSFNALSHVDVFPYTNGDFGRAYAHTIRQSTPAIDTGHDFFGIFTFDFELDSFPVEDILFFRNILLDIAIFCKSFGLDFFNQSSYNHFIKFHVLHIFSHPWGDAPQYAHRLSKYINISFTIDV
ncbi:predicted protein [Methanosarcina acetivorans C2A]|uniref:Uncharacterized protein n=1 Tax=Methanosarcina acetivorans (strain ATCC 35395 / DSM 2834 / JCM 12185 / C2A) TaxID=188937 RepID=Q8TPN1_METAC|nr:predicted protein [Methanosarcina acetivorans C2A]